MEDGNPKHSLFDAGNVAAGMKLLASQGLRPFRGAAWPQAVLPNREVCDSQKDPNEVNNVALDMKKNGDTQF
jgi:hypothetical protein